MISRYDVKGNISTPCFIGHLSNTDPEGCFAPRNLRCEYTIHSKENASILLDFDTYSPLRLIKVISQYLCH